MSAFNFGGSTNSPNTLFGKSPSAAFSTNTPSTNAFGQPVGQFGTTTTNNNSGSLFNSPKSNNQQQLSGNLSNQQSTFGAFSNNQPTFGNNTNSVFGNANGSINATNPLMNSTIPNNSAGFGANIGNQNLSTSSQPSAGGFNFGQNSSNIITSKPNNIFGAATSNASVFGTGSTFGNQQQSSPFGSNQKAPFATGSPINSFGNVTQGTSFGGAVTTTPFGGVTQVAPFGNASPAPYGVTSQPSMFGSSNQSTIFGNSVNAPASGNSTQTTFGTSNTFGGNQQPACGNTTQPTLFGSNTQSNVFGGGTTTSAFGGAAQPSLFGSSASPAAFGTTNQPSTFGSTNQPSTFGMTNQPSTFGSIGQPSTFSNNTQPTGFGATNQSTAFGATNQPTAFGATNQPTAFGATNQPTAFGATNQPTAFGATNQSTAFGATNQATTFGATNQPTTFGATNQATTFGATNQPTAFGATNQATAFGATNQPTAFGATNQATTFGATNQPTTFGATNQATTFGATNQATTFGATNQATTFGATNQATTFGATNQPSTFGTTPQPAAFGATVQPSAFRTTPQISTFGTTNQSTILGNTSQPSAFGSTSQSLQFGSTAQTTSFGNVTQPPTFGGVTTQTNPSQIPSFGGTITGNATQNSLFGNKESSSTLGTAAKLPFGGINTTPSSLNPSTTSQSSFSIGGNTSSSSLFGSATPLSNTLSFGTTTTTSSIGNSAGAATAGLGTNPLPVTTLSSIISPVIGSSVTISNSIGSLASTTPISTSPFGGFNVASSTASKQPFSLGATSTPFSINSDNTSLSSSITGSNNTTTSTPFSFNNTLATTNSSVLPQPSFGLGGVTATKPSFTSPLAISSTTAKKGLGGSPISSQNGSIQTKEEAQKNSGVKQIKDTELAPEIKESLETFKKFVSEQKKQREEIVKSHDASNLISRVDEECQTFGQSICEVSNGVLKIQSQCIKMKNNVLKEVSNIKIAQTNADSSFGVSGGMPESSSYFARKSRDLENRASLYLQEVELVESLLNPNAASRQTGSASQGGHMSTRELVEIIRGMDDEFMGLAARLYVVHERVKAAKAEHLRRLRTCTPLGANNSRNQLEHNPFLAIEGRYGDAGEQHRVAVRPSGGQSGHSLRMGDCVGGSPFETGHNSQPANQTRSANVLGGFVGFGGANHSGSMPIFGGTPTMGGNLPFGGGSPGFSGFSNSSASSRPGSLFSSDGGSNKKRR